MALSNHSARVLVSIIAIPFILAATYIGKLFFFIFVLGIGIITFYEFSNLLKNKDANLAIWLGYVGVILIITSNYIFFADTLSFLILFVVIVSGVELFRNSGSALNNIGGVLFSTLYVGFFAGSLIGIREFYPRIGDLYLRGGYIIISMLASIWLCDSAAYYGGTKFGKHKLFPRVSPKKSWEGAIFGFIFAVITMIISQILIT